MTDTTYKRFVKHWEQVTELPPQTLGPLTPLYKWFVPKLKVMPWPMVVILSVVFVCALYFILGATITLLASILQRGF